MIPGPLAPLTGPRVSWTEPDPRIEQSGFEVIVPETADRKEDPSISVSDHQRPVELSDSIPAACFDQPKQRDEIALHRFVLATAQEKDAEAVIDYVISLVTVTSTAIFAEP
jgi:hypothetical protein